MFQVCDLMTKREDHCIILHDLSPVKLSKMDLPASAVAGAPDSADQS